MADSLSKRRYGDGEGADVSVDYTTPGFEKPTGGRSAEFSVGVASKYPEWDRLMDRLMAPHTEDPT